MIKLILDLVNFLTHGHEEDKGDRWHRVEHSSGQFKKRFRLPEDGWTR
jgi:HSP20 family molecular chaperone IbpA